MLIYLYVGLSAPIPVCKSECSYSSMQVKEHPVLRMGIGVFVIAYKYRSIQIGVNVKEHPSMHTDIGAPSLNQYRLLFTKYT